MAETAAAYIFKVVASTALKAGATKATAAFLAKSAVFAAKVGLTVGASAALNAAFAPRVSTPDSRIAQRQPTPERASAFGRVRSAGAYTLYSTAASDSIDVLAFHDGRIAGIDQIYLHDDPVSLGTGPLGSGFVLGDARTDQYYEAIYIDTRLGTANQSAFTRAAGKVPGQWSPQHCMDGVAALEMLCLGPKKERLPKVYPLGLPRPSVVYRAQYCFDFRQSGQSIENWRGWTPGSRNPVLQMVTYMCNPAVPDPAEPDRALGLGMDFDAEIAPRLDAWIAAANVCDQQVPKKGGGTEPRYRCDFEYFVGEDPADTLARFLAAFDGWMSETGDGALTVKAGAYDGSAVEIDSDWVIGHAINRGVPDEEMKNVFVGFYTDPAKKFSQVEGAPWFDQGSIALTGKRRYERVPMTQVQSHGQLTRLLKRIALRRNAEARGTLRLSLPALDLMGERWLKFPADFPNSEFLRGKIVEVEALEIDFSGGGAVILDWAIYDTDADAFDPDTEEGVAPPAPSESELSAPPVIDTGDVTAEVETESRFGGQRQAVAVLTFPAPVRSYDIAGAGSVDVPRTDLGWRVRWRVRPSGGWTESAISGDVIEGDEVDGWTVRLRTPDLPRASLDVQIASVGPRDDQGGWSDSVPVDVDAATAPALAAPANVTATAALEESEGGVKRPALTVGFDAITSPEAQMVLVAIKPAGDPDSAFAQIDAIEPRLGGKTVYTIPYGRTVDVGLQTWAQWREPSDWAVVEGVEIPGEVVASGIGSLSESDIKERFDDGEILAQTIWEDALDRHDDVRGILQEFGTAEAVTDAARVEAIAAADSATEAGNSASAAAGFEASAQTAATAAGESASAASVSAGAAASSANSAGNSASAAAGFSAQASSFASDAEQYSQATLALRAEAQTAASNAASSATQAATSSNDAASAASLASDKANTATAAASSATDSAAAASDSEARAAQNAVVSATYGASAKQDVKDAEDFFTSDLSELDYEAGAFTGWTEATLAGGGVVVWSTASAPALCTRARFVPVPGRRYRATAVWRYVSGAPGEVTVGFRANESATGTFAANRWASVEAGASGEWREASYDITATEAMAVESWCPVIRRSGATGRIEVRSLIWRDIDALRAVGQSQITVYSTADEAFAGLLQQVAIGADYAGMRFALQNTGGAVASAINFASQKLGFGLAYDDPSFVIDPLTESAYGLSPDRSVKTWEQDFSTGRNITRKPDGTVISDNFEGGIQRDGIRPGALGSQGIGFENRHYFLPNNSTTRTASQATAAFAPLSIETNAIAFPSSEWVSVRAGVTMKATSDMFGHFNGRIMLVRRATYPTAGQVTTTLAEDTPHFSVAVNGFWSSGNRRDAGKIELRPWVFEIFDNPPQNGGEDPVSIKYQLIVTAESIGGGYFENFNDNNGARRFYGDRAFVHAVEVASGPIGVDVRLSNSAPAALPSPPAVSITPGGNFLQWN